AFVPPGANIGLKIRRPARTVAFPIERDTLQGISRRAAVGSGRNGIVELTIAIHIDGAVVNRERRGGHIADGGRYIRAVRLRDLRPCANREDVTAVDAARPAPET